MGKFLHRMCMNRELGLMNWDFSGLSSPYYTLQLRTEVAHLPFSSEATEHHRKPCTSQQPLPNQPG